MKADEQYFPVVMLFFIIVIKTQFWNFGLFRPWPPSFAYHKVTTLVLSLSPVYCPILFLGPSSS